MRPCFGTSASLLQLITHFKVDTTFTFTYLSLNVMVRARVYALKTCGSVCVYMTRLNRRRTQTRASTVKQMA